MAEKIYRLINDKKKNDFLMTYIRCGSISKAARKCKIDRTTHYQWMKNEKYAQAFEKARQHAGDLLEEEAYRRAVEGYSQPIYYKGEKVGSKKVYSDYLLAELLRGAKPEVYRDNKTEVNANVNINLSDAVAAARERVANAKETTGDKS